MIDYVTSETKEDLSGILALQKINLSESLTKEEIKSQGFVTVVHNYDQLKKLNDIEKFIIAKDKNKIIAYLLAMTEQSKSELPVLIPMFDTFNSILFKGKIIASYNYIVVGQVCVAKQYRGQGILDNCYTTYKNHFKGKYDFTITEIDAKNMRSLNAHKRIGFTEIYRYFSSDNTEWCIVLWNWQKEG